MQLFGQKNSPIHGCSRCSANIKRTSNYLTPFCSNNFEANVFEKKVALECEIKLKEFNFNILHGFLPCSRNLMKWKIKDYDHCDVSGEYQILEYTFCMTVGIMANMAVCRDWF